MTDEQFAQFLAVLTGIGNSVATLAAGQPEVVTGIAGVRDRVVELTTALVDFKTMVGQDPSAARLQAIAQAVEKTAPPHPPHQAVAPHRGRG